MKIVQTKSFQIAINEYGNSTSDCVAILMPGRLDTKDYINFVKHGEFLAKNGYMAISIDPPFTWDSPGDLQNYTTSNYVRAVNELIEYFGNKTTLLLGHSRGGATAMIASSNPNVDAIVLINAAYGSPTPPNQKKIIDGCLPESRDIPPGDTRTEKRQNFMLPMDYFKDGNKHNPVGALKRFKGKKLLIHATHDEFCSSEEVREIYNSLAEPKSFLEIGGTHDYRLFPEVIEQINQSMLGFIRNNYDS